MSRKITRGLIVTLATILITLAVAVAIYALGQNTVVRSAIVGQGAGLGGRERAMPANFDTASGARVMPPAGEHHAEGGAGDARAWASVARNIGLIALVTAAVVLPQRLFKLVFRRRPAGAASRA